MSLPNNQDSHDDLENEIAELEDRLRKAKERLTSKPTSSPSKQNGAQPNPIPLRLSPSQTTITNYLISPSPNFHFLLLLSDSALPLGSFAFSSGLESYLAHMRHTNQPRSSFSFTDFLPLSLASHASTTLPFVLAAHRTPSAAAALDDIYDAAVVCTVGRRASVAQGRAMLGLWERSFAPALPAAKLNVLRPFTALLRQQTNSNSTTGDTIPLVSAHLGPLFGAICNLLGLSLRQTAYVFMLSHAKALISAAVRASLFGPFQAQRVLAGGELQGMIAAVVEREWETGVEEAGQSVPVIDLWVGRHEMLYSRIFNS